MKVLFLLVFIGARTQSCFSLRVSLHRFSSVFVLPRARRGQDGRLRRQAEADSDALSAALARIMELEAELRQLREQTAPGGGHAETAEQLRHENAELRARLTASEVGAQEVAQEHSVEPSTPFSPSLVPLPAQPRRRCSWKRHNFEPRSPRRARSLPLPRTAPH